MLMQITKIFIDGASRGNPGHSGIGIRILDEKEEVLREYKEYLGRTYTNNQAEYLALIKALELAKAMGLYLLEIYSDSELLVRQLNGLYQVKNAQLKRLYTEVKVLESSFQKISYLHINRGENEAADELANEAINEELSR